LRLKRGPGFKSGSNSTSTSPLFNGVGLLKEHIPVSERTNPFLGSTLPLRKDIPIWSYRFFGNRGGALIMTNSDLGIRFPIGDLIRKIFFKGCGLQILKYGMT
jgi:hypothetical protein